MEATLLESSRIECRLCKTSDTQLHLHHSHCSYTGFLDKRRFPLELRHSDPTSSEWWLETPSSHEDMKSRHEALTKHSQG